MIDNFIDKDEVLNFGFNEKAKTSKGNMSMPFGLDKNGNEVVTIRSQIGRLKEIEKSTRRQINLLEQISRKLDKEDNGLSEIQSKIDEFDRMISSTTDKEIKEMLRSKREVYSKKLAQEKAKLLKVDLSFDALEIIDKIEEVNKEYERLLGL